MRGGGGVNGGSGGGGGDAFASLKVVATMRLRIERAQGGVAAACRKAILFIEVLVAVVVGVRMLVEASEVGLTQSEHVLVVAPTL